MYCFWNITSPRLTDDVSFIFCLIIVAVVSELFPDSTLIFNPFMHKLFMRIYRSSYIFSECSPRLLIFPQNCMMYEFWFCLYITELKNNLKKTVFKTLNVQNLMHSGLKYVKLKTKKIRKYHFRNIKKYMYAVWDCCMTQWGEKSFQK